MRIHARALSVMLALLGLAACAPAPIYTVLPGTLAVTPQQVAQSPERYAHSPVIWGGAIVEVRNFVDHSEIELLGYPLDSSQRPRLNQPGGGRFIAVLPGYVEALNYPAGAPMTVSGTLDGSRAGQVGNASYVFPLVKAAQTHRWTAAEMGQGRSNVQFGVGVGVGIR